METSLYKIKIGESCTIKYIKITGAMRRRLFDIGLIEGTKISCILKSPSGNPTAYKIRGAIIAIRKTDSKNIMVIV